MIVPKAWSSSYKNKLIWLTKHIRNVLKTLTDFEASVGSDLGELRMLNAAFSGQSDLRQQAIALEAESRQANLQTRDAEQLARSAERGLNKPQSS